MKINKARSSLNAYGTSVLLQEIVSHSGNVINQDNLINIQISLSNGYVMKGSPIKIEDKNVLFQLDNRGLAYFHLDDLQSIEILNPERILSVLTGGEYFEVPVDEIPTNLELKRLFSDAQEKLNLSYKLVLKTSLVSDKNITNQEKYQLKKLLLMIEDALIRIVSDEIGKDALKKIKGLELKSTTKDVFVGKELDQIILNINFNKSFETHFAQELLSLLEEKL